MWAELADLSSRQLYHETGLLQIGPAGGVVLPGVLASAGEHGLEIKELIPTEVEDRYRGFRVPKTMKVIFERRAGYLHIEAFGVQVSTDQGNYRVERLVVTPGAWEIQLLGELGIPFEVRRESVFWYAVSDPTYRAKNSCPGFLFETPVSVFYGVSEITPTVGIKVAEHYCG